MATTKAQLNKYFRQIYFSLPCNYKEKRKIIKDLKQNIAAYMIEDPDVSIGEITDQFGTPGQITASYLEEMDQDKLVSNLRIKGKMFLILIGTIAFILIFLKLTIMLITIGD